MSRFIGEPLRHYDFTYIGDIDILIMEDVVPFHLAKAERHKSVYDNVTRPGLDRMSGLQFCLADYFRLTRAARGDAALQARFPQDEEFLYQAISRSGLPVRRPRGIEEFLENRPTHGVHISLNREPFRKGGMAFSCEQKFAAGLVRAIGSWEFRRMVEPLISPWMRGIFNAVLPLVEAIANGEGQ